MTPKPPLKKVGQLLQEQQEPFELEDYLLERKYSKKSLNLERGFTCSGGKLGSIKKFRKGFEELNKILRVSYKKLVSIKEKQKTKDLDNDAWATNVARGKSCPRVAESEKFSSPCSSTVFDSFSGRENEEASTSRRRDHANSSTSDTSSAPEPCKLKVVRDMKTGKPGLIRGRPKDNRLGNGVILNKKAPEDSILSATLWELLLYSAATEKTSSIGTAELQELSNCAPQFLISERVFHQTKQLLFDCVKEVVEIHSVRSRALGSEELGRLICEKMKSLEEGEEGANLSNLLNSDYLDSVAEWSDFKPQKQLIGTEIGEIILKEITNEIVTELNDNL